MLILLFILKYKRPEEQPFTAPFRSFYIHLPYLHYFLNFSSILSIIVASYLFFLSYKQTPRRNRNHRNQCREHYRFRCKRCIAVIARRKDRCSCTGWHSRHDDCYTCFHRIQSGRQADSICQKRKKEQTEHTEFERGRVDNLTQFDIGQNRADELQFPMYVTVDFSTPGSCSCVAIRNMPM